MASTSREGNCWDNEVAACFSGALEGEPVDRAVYATSQAAITSIADYVEKFCDVQRGHTSIGNVSPVEYELRLRPRSQAA